MRGATSQRWKGGRKDTKEKVARGAVSVLVGQLELLEGKEVVMGDAPKQLELSEHSKVVLQLKVQLLY
jgi:hypothetical protein